MKKHVGMKRVVAGATATVTPCPFCNHPSEIHEDRKGCQATVMAGLFGETFEIECMCDSGDGKSR